MRKNFPSQVPLELFRLVGAQETNKSYYI